MEVGPQRASIRAASTAPQIVPPSASGLPSLCSEMRKRVAQGDFRLHYKSAVFKCIPVGETVPAQTTAWCCPVLACKVGRRIRHSGFLVGWYHLSLEPTDLRRHFSDVRTGRVLGAVLCPSCASWSHCGDAHADPGCFDVWGEKPCSPQTRIGNRHLKRLLTLIL